jgi:hypothetical protein
MHDAGGIGFMEFDAARGDEGGIGHSLP